MTAPGPERRTAHELLPALRRGELRAEALVRACLERIEARDDIVRAWAFVDADIALAQARALDGRLAAGETPGPLHGLPVGLKDILDTADMPTECGTPIHAGRRPERDSFVAARLRAAGAVILGKTVTTEFALSHPSATRNPHDPTRTPGGSSSGSAAAVADFMAPLAIGSQTVGSTIRPGSYCGIWAYKPTLGSISRRGMALLSRRLDHVGLLARSAEDLALLGDMLMVADPDDPDMRPEPGCALSGALDVAFETGAPRLRFARTPAWEQATPDARAAYEDLCARLGNIVETVDLPAAFDHAAADHQTVLGGCLAAVFAEHHAHRPEMLSGTLRARVERGLAVSAGEYVAALDRADRLRSALDEYLDGCDALLSPAAPGEAPADLATTGNAVFNGFFTLAGAPAVGVPALRGENGMPLGVQVVGRRGDDARALRVARWLGSRPEAGDPEAGGLT